MEQTLKILIADENNEFRNKTKAALKQLGFTRFEEAVSGEDALQIINRFHPDVVLLDVWLSRMDCVQVIRSAEKMSFRTLPTPIFMKKPLNREPIIA